MNETASGEGSTLPHSHMSQHPRPHRYTQQDYVLAHNQALANAIQEVGNQVAGAVRLSAHGIHKHGVDRFHHLLVLPLRRLPHVVQRVLAEITRSNHGRKERCGACDHLHDTFKSALWPATSPNTQVSGAYLLV